jgi:hypothetical protein
MRLKSQTELQLWRTRWRKVPAFQYSGLALEHKTLRHYKRRIRMSKSESVTWSGGVPPYLVYVMMNNARAAGDRTLETALYWARKRRVGGGGERETATLYKLIPCYKIYYCKCYTYWRNEVDCNSVLTVTWVQTTSDHGQLSTSCDNVV